jgi:sporulation protein YlmC with PRC-barrel domain
MYTRKSLTKAVLTLTLVAVFTGYVAAQPMHDQALPTGRMDGTLVRASQIMGQEIRNPQGERLGRVYDVVLTEDLDAISYIAVSRGGILGIGQTLHAIPWDAVQVGFGGEAYVASISERDLQQTRGFPAGNWPARVDAGWALEDDQPVYRGFAPEETRDVQNRRFSRIRGLMVRTADRRSGGTIRDLAIAADTGQVAYTIVAIGGLFGLGEQYAVLPQGAITYLPGARMASVETTRETVLANAFAPGRLPNLADPAFAQNVHQQYGVEPDWPVLGFVPPQERPRIVCGSTGQIGRWIAPRRSCVTGMKSL